MYADYQTLGLSENATQKDVKKKFQYLAKQVHPDRKKYDLQVAHEKFIKIRKAYDNINTHLKQLNDIASEEKMIKKTKLWYKAKKLKEEQEKREQERKKNLMRQVYQQNKDIQHKQQQMLNNIFNNANNDTESFSKIKYTLNKKANNIKDCKHIDKWNMLFMKLNT